MEEKIDLHIHTEFSDAPNLSVEKALDEIFDGGITYFSMTDHDTLRGNILLFDIVDKIQKGGIELDGEEAKLKLERTGEHVKIKKNTLKTIEKNGINFTEGIELSSLIQNSGSFSTYSDQEMHLLLYGINDCNLMENDKILTRVQKIRNRRSLAIMEKYKAYYGDKFGIKEIFDSEPSHKGPFISRWHIALEILKLARSGTGSLIYSTTGIPYKDLIHGIQNQTARGGKMYVPYSKEFITLDEAFDLKKRYAKISVIAHPGMLITDYQKSLSARDITDLICSDADGFTDFYKRKYPGMFENSNIHQGITEMRSADGTRTWFQNRISAYFGNIDYYSMLNLMMEYLEQKATSNKHLKSRLEIISADSNEKSWADFKTLIEYLQTDSRLDGLEVFSTKHDKDMTLRLNKFVEDFNRQVVIDRVGKPLIKTAGSDYHGYDMTPDIKLGDECLSQFPDYNPKSILETFKEKLK